MCNFENAPEVALYRLWLCSEIPRRHIPPVRLTEDIEVAKRWLDKHGEDARAGFTKGFRVGEGCYALKRKDEGSTAWVVYAGFNF